MKHSELEQLSTFNISNITEVLNFLCKIDVIKSGLLGFRKDSFKQIFGKQSLVCNFEYRTWILEDSL